VISVEALYRNEGGLEDVGAATLTMGEVLEAAEARERRGTYALARHPRRVRAHPACIRNTISARIWIFYVW
jgi:hypothetical protein